MTVDLVIRDVILWSGEAEIDIAVDKGKIIALKKVEDMNGQEEIDGRGARALPGLIDAHVHFRTPGGAEKENWKTGSLAAARGGVTTVMDMPNTNPPTVTNALLEEKHFLIRSQKPCIDYRLYLGATRGNIHEIENTKAAGVKVYLASSTGNLLMNDYAHLEEIIKASPVPVLVHAEDQDCIERNRIEFEKKLLGEGKSIDEVGVSLHSLIRSAECAAICVEKVLDIVKRVRKPVYFCHVSSKEEIDLLEKAKMEEGMPVFIEVAPHHLFLTEKVYETHSNFAKVNPPLRSEESAERLWKALVDGTVDVVASDHAPHMISEKIGEYHSAPSGVPGVETMLPLLLNAVNKGVLPLSRVVDLTNRNAANIFGLFSKLGIKQGSDADITLVDMNKKQRVEGDHLATKCGWTPYEGFVLQGWPIMTISRGKIVYAA